MRAKDFDLDKFMLEEWPNALESGEYEQGKGQLYDDGKYCCLGVACDLLAKKNLLRGRVWQKHGCLPDRAVKLLGISDDGAYLRPKSKNLDAINTTLVDDNDSGVSFEKIAQKIRLAWKKKLFS
jgi:hypothetical protein